MKDRDRWICRGCKRHTGQMHEHYVLLDEVWAKIHDSKIGMFCIGCAEVRLGRRLIPSDFSDSYVNNPRTAPQSVRLRSRLRSA